MIACLRSPLGALIGRPWFDRAALAAVSGWFFPLSRLWAAARAAEGSVERYFAEVPMPRTGRAARALRRRLDRFERVRAKTVESERAWEDAFFGPAAAAPEALREAERRRLLQRHAYNTQRRLFAPFAAHGRARPFRWQIPGPAEVEAVYGGFLAEPESAFALPGRMPRVEVSRAFQAAPGRRDYWLRFPSPSARMNDQAVARVYEPPGAADPPTLIFGHGIGVEFDHWRGVADEIEALVAMGVRVVRPEAPWHGRRVLPGRYGGEQFVATAPCGALDHFTAAAGEWAVLIDWCRQAGSGPLAIGGSSLGAMTAQIVADRARRWPERLRPDAMFLVTHCGRVEEALHGALARSWGVAGATIAHGWTNELAQRYTPLLDPVDATSVPPENIVSVLGARDDVTPYWGAKALIDRWDVPEENRFIWRRGHFSVPIAMLRNHAPLVRFREVMARLA
ncbi:MAG: hypothetical protein F4Y03_18455 [Alphaproteobacteria bacterium]|nr:hypothetical protein [Alphaproteobacteria bacterium]